MSLLDSAMARLRHYVDGRMTDAAPFRAIVTGTSGNLTTIRRLEAATGENELYTKVTADTFVAGDEVLCLPASGKPVVLGRVRRASGGVAPFLGGTDIRDGNTTGTFDSTTGTALTSLQITLSGMDAALSYYVEAEGEALLQSAVTTTLVTFGVRVGTGGTPVWGYGHKLTSLVVAGAVGGEIVTGVTSVQVNGMVKNSVAGTQTIGGGLLRARAWPL